MAYKSGYKNNDLLFEVLLLLSREAVLEDPFDVDEDSSFDFRGSAEVFSWLLKESGSQYQQRTLAQRIRFAINMCGVPFQPDMAALIRLPIEDAAMDPAMCNISNSLQRNLLHCVAWRLGEHYGDRFTFLDEDEEVKIQHFAEETDPRFFDDHGGLGFSISR
jgi:hypothetical protein